MATRTAAPGLSTADLEQIRAIRNAEHRSGARLRAPQIARGFHLQVPQKCRTAHRDFGDAVELPGTERLLLAALLRLLAAALRRTALLS